MYKGLILAMKYLNSFLPREIFSTYTTILLISIFFIEVGLLS